MSRMDAMRMMDESGKPGTQMNWRGRRKLVGILFLLVSMPLAAGGSPIPADAFPGVELDEPLEDQYATGQALSLKGRATDSSKAGGQILFRFVPQDEGEDVRVFIGLEGTRFSGYQIFGHEAAGTYDLEVYLGGTEEGQLGFVGRFPGLEIVQGSGSILLPGDFFTGVMLDQVFPAEYLSGEEVVLAGQVVESSKVGGQILFNFVPRSGDAPTPVYIPLQGTRFDGRHLFRHDETGTYDLEVYLGGADDEQLAFIGRFAIAVAAGDAEIAIPVEYFQGLVLDQPLPAELPVGRPYELTGVLKEGYRGFRIELVGTAGERVIPVGSEDGRFRLPLQLREEEMGELEFRIVVESETGEYSLGGAFPIRGVVPPPAGSLEVGALGVSMLPGGSETLGVINRGDAPLAELRFEVEGPFRLGSVPQNLAPGEAGEVGIEYTGDGEEQGMLRIYSDDPLRPVRQVALQGMGSLDEARQMAHWQADAQGRMTLELDFAQGDYALVLYAGQSDPRDPDAEYAFSLGGTLAGAKAVPGTSSAGWERRDLLKSELREMERELAVRQLDFPPRSGKTAAVDYKLGERRDFVFPEIGGMSARQVSATVVAVEEKAVAWVQDSLGETDGTISAAQIQEVIARFSGQDRDLVVEKFGRASDVDGDGKVSFLFTGLVDDVGGLAGFYSATAVVPAEAGGDGNMTDLIFLSPTARLETYRSLLVHEFQHLVNFNQHVLVRRGTAEENWLNEGLSHLSEDLVAGHAVSGQDQVIRAYLSAPSSVGLVGEALLDPAKRGAAYLFVRSLVDRLGDGVLRRLVGTGLFGRDNVEAATGEDFAELLAFWGARIYASGLGLNDHDRFNFASPLLTAGEHRGFPQPAALEYRIGDRAVQGSLSARGVAFVQVRGQGKQSLEIQTDPEGWVGAVGVPLSRNFAPPVFMPADYIPGIVFSQLIPGTLVAGTEYNVAGEVLDGVVDLLFRFVGAEEDTVRFGPRVEGGRFSQTLRLDRDGEYELQIFTGTGDRQLDFAGGFGPVRVISIPANTAVIEAPTGLPGSFSLEPVYPNPFNSRCVVRVAAPEGGGDVVLEVYDILGQRVRVLHQGGLPAGWSAFAWDGRDGEGRGAASGLYLWQLKGKGFRTVRRAVLTR